MRLARVLGAIGRGLISAGVIVLLFVAYQLWGTGLQHSAAQGDLGNEFEENTGIEVASDAVSLAEAARASQEAIGAGQIVASESVPTPSASDDTEDDDTAADADAQDDGDTSAAQESAADLFEADFDVEQRQAILAKLYPEPGKPLARINIPDINVDQISVEGVSVEDLRKGPGHYQSTPNPGQAGNSAIAGHRTTYGAPFHRVDELKPGDPIFVTTAQGVFEYRVVGYDENGQPGGDLGYFIVSPSDTWVLDQTEGENTLTLTACHPKYSARQRIIVRAELVGEPAPTIPREEAVDLGPISIDSGSTDERAAQADAVEGEADADADEIPEEEQVIIGDDVAADDDDTVDADGNPIEVDAEGGDDATDTAPDAGETGDTTDATADEEPATTETAADSDAVAATSDDGANADAAEADVVDDSDFELTSAQTPFNTGDQDFGEGLNGDPTKVRPAIMWGVSGLFIWLAAWFMGKRLDRKWTLYAMGLLPFGFVLWSTFVNVDQALPSY